MLANFPEVTGDTGQRLERLKSEDRSGGRVVRLWNKKGEARRREDFKEGFGSRERKLHGAYAVIKSGREKRVNHQERGTGRLERFCKEPSDVARTALSPVDPV